MLTLTRHVNEEIVIGDLGRVIVLELRSRQAKIKVVGPGISREITMGTGECIALRGSAFGLASEIVINLQLCSVIRGEARLGFHAPKEVPINRLERYQERHIP